MAASLGEEGAALFIDARSLEYQRVSLPPGADLVVIDSGVAHDHAAGDYNTRRAECEWACALLGVRQLRDLGAADLPRVAGLPSPLDRRARHVITEDDRVLAAVGQLLQIEELMQLDLQQAQAKFRLATGKFLIDELVLRSPNLQLSATGSVSFDGKLALESTLTINEKIRGQLFRGIRENFVATADPGRFALPFHISGTVERPRTDLMERAVGADLKDLGGVIDALLGRSKGKKKKNADAVTPAPSAVPTP